MAKRKTINPKFVLAIMLAGTFIASAAQSMLTSSLPAIMDDFNIDADLGQVLTTFDIYTVGIVAAFSAFLITRFNTRHLFLGSLVLFLVGCAVDYAAPSFWMVLMGRIMQAAAAGVMLPLNQVTALKVYPPSQAGRALGLVGLVFGFAPVLGPTLSGLITDLIGWRDIFLVLGGLSALVLVASLPTVKDMGAHEKVELDIASLILYSVGLVVFMFGVIGLEEYGLLNISGIVLVLTGIAVLVVFILRQFRIPQPYLKLTLFKEHRFALGVILLVLTQVAMVAATLQIPLYIQEVHGLSAFDSGLMLLPGALCLPILNPVCGRLYDRIGARTMGIVGFSLLFVGTGSNAFLGPDTPVWFVSFLYIIRMAGVAFTLMPMTAFSMSRLDQEDTPQATAIMNSFRQIMGSLGSSLMVSLVTAFSTNAEASAGVSMSGFQVSFSIQAGILAVGLVLVIILVKAKDTSEGA